MKKQKEASENLNFSNLFSDRQFDAIRTHFTRLTGNKLGTDKRSLVEGRLRKYLLSANLDVESYLQAIKTDPTAQSEFISVLTTHKTDWFRETPHFDFLKKYVTSHSHQKDWKIWSAACSTGEEVYSLLMAMLELGAYSPKILGTDISDKCVSAGQSGVYAQQTVDTQVPPHLKSKYFFRRVAEKNSTTYKFDPQYQRMTKWKKFNLIESSLGAPIQFDFIFLRNVLIYFDMETGHRVIERLLNHLKPGGHLIIGLSETIKDLDSLNLVRVENSVFLKEDK